MKIAIVINAQRYTPDLKAALEATALTQKYDITYDLFVTEPCDLEKILKSLNYETYNACLIGGGDGTVRLAAEVLVNHDLPLIVLPLGTFNVFANSLGYPNNIEEIFAMIKNKKTKSIDIVEVNGNVFLNHAWVGFYYYLLQMRKKHKKILGKSKLLKAIFFALFIFKRLPIYEFKIKANEQINYYRTCLIFVSNNETANDILSLGKRPLLATGLLDINILNCHTRWQLFLCMCAIIFTDFKNSKFITHFQVDELTVSAVKNPIKLVVDGELLKLDSPIRFKNYQKKLSVITP